MVKRRDLFYERLEEVKKQIAALQKTMHTLNYKCWYYDTAVALGNEDMVKNLPLEKIPEELRDYKI